MIFNYFKSLNLSVNNFSKFQSDKKKSVFRPGRIETGVTIVMFLSKKIDKVLFLF